MNQYKAFIDGGSRGNPGNAASAFVLSQKNGQGVQQHLLTKSKFEGVQTNNMAEYLALSNLVLYLMDLSREPMSVDVYCDSLLVVNQVNRVWRTKDAHLENMKGAILGAAKATRIGLHLVHVRREKNTEADKAVNRVLDQVEVLAKRHLAGTAVEMAWDSPLTCSAADWHSKFFTNL